MKGSDIAGVMCDVGIEEVTHLADGLSACSATSMSYSATPASLSAVRSNDARRLALGIDVDLWGSIRYGQALPDCWHGQGMWCSPRPCRAGANTGRGARRCQVRGCRSGRRRSRGCRCSARWSSKTNLVCQTIEAHLRAVLNDRIARSLPCRTTTWASTISPSNSPCDSASRLYVLRMRPRASDPPQVRRIDRTFDEQAAEGWRH